MHKWGKWGISTAILGAITFVLLAILAILVMERQKPWESDPDSAQLEEQRLRFELERERIALESLRMRAQIQTDLAAVDASLAAAAAAEQHAARAEQAGAPDDAPAPEPEILPVVYLEETASGGLGNFVPDSLAYQQFSEPLESYGDWYETDDYGPVWQPDQVYVEHSWAPYTNGSWGYSNYGWNWNSYDPFGWACDHYGRWLYISRHGWVWVPGSQWAPGWVSWRSCNNYIGWAPLPPCATWNRGVGIGGWVDGYCNIGPSHYNFVDREHFGGRDCRSSIVDRSRNPELYARSRNITRLHHDKGGIHNDGPDYDEASARSSNRIERRTIDLAAERGMTREKIEASRSGGKAGAQPERLAGVKRETGWAGVGDRGEALRLRQQAVTQARGSLREQERAITKSQRSRALTAITSTTKRSTGSVGELPYASNANDVEVVQVGRQMAPAAAHRAAQQVPTGSQAGGAQPKSQPAPDHFAAEQAQRDAILAKQQAAVTERTVLARQRRAEEFAARQRLESQIQNRSGSVAMAGRASRSRQSSAIAASDPRSSSAPNRSLAGSGLGEVASQGSQQSLTRSRTIPAGQSSSPSRSVGRLGSAAPGLASRSTQPSRSLAASQRRSQPAAETSTPSRSVSRVAATPNRSRAAAPSSRVSTSAPRQQKQVRSAPQPQRAAAPSPPARSLQPQSSRSASPSSQSKPSTRATSSSSSRSSGAGGNRR